MNSSTLSSKKKRRSSSKFLISNKQAKLLKMEKNRKYRRDNLLDKNRHINLNDSSITDESVVDTNAIKIEQQEPIVNNEPQYQMELTHAQVQPEVSQQNDTTKTISKLSELKNKFTNFKNTIVKSISNIKKPPSESNFNQIVKEEKKIPTIKASASFHRNGLTTSTTTTSLSRQTSRKEFSKENSKPPISNEPSKRLSTLTRSSSVSTIKTTTTQVKTLKKYESSTSCRLSNVNNMHLQSTNNQRPAFNQYAKITYNDRVLYEPAASPIHKKVELRRILAHKNMSSSQTKLDALN